MIRILFTPATVLKQAPILNRVQLRRWSMTTVDGPACMPLGLDLDGTIDEALIFFKWLAECWPGKVYVLTYRSDREKAIRDLNRFGIRHDELILVSSFAEKARIVEREGIKVYFDDQDEMTRDIGESTTVFKIRNGGNFDYHCRKWLYSDDTGRRV